MNIANNKSILLLLALLFQVFTANAQNSSDRLHGTYNGSATVEMTTGTGSSSSIGQKTFDVAIEKKDNDTKLIIKGYKLGRYTFEDVTFNHLTVTYQPEHKRWKFTANPLSGDYVQAKGTPFTMQLWGSVMGSDNYIYENGKIEFTFEIYNREDAKAKNVFKGENAVAAGIASIADNSNKNVLYDLQGRHVQIPRKGLYIINGRKVLLNKN